MSARDLAPVEDMAGCSVLINDQPWESEYLTSYYGVDIDAGSDDPKLVKCQSTARPCELFRGQSKSN